MAAHRVDSLGYLGTVMNEGNKLKEITQPLTKMPFPHQLLTLFLFCLFFLMNETKLVEIKVRLRLTSHRLKQ